MKKLLAPCTEALAVVYGEARKGDPVAVAILLWAYAPAVYSLYVACAVLSR